MLRHPFNYAQINYSLSDAIEHTDNLINELSSRSSRETSDVYGGLPVDFGHILGHLNESWHHLFFLDTEIQNENQALYEATTQSIPNWSGEHRIVDLEESLTLSQPIQQKRRFCQKKERVWCNIESMLTYLEALKSECSLLSDQIDDDKDLPPLRKLISGFESACDKLVLSWHVKFLDEGSELSIELAEQLRKMIPAWNNFGDFELVPLEKRFGSYDPYA